MAVQEDLLEKGFQLAYFIFPSRSTALRILTGALNKLRVQQGRESRRSYWRDKHLKRGITRITREQSDALQWLIFYESDQYEKEQEDTAAHTARDMVVRYIKNLVRMTTAMSSFYVNIGLHRLLHNYSTSETQRVYEAVTDRYLGADEYRRAKSTLMEKLARRFGASLKTLRAQHGELRFEAMVAEEQGSWAQLVDACLKAFTPWSTATACPVPSDFDAAQGKLPSRLSGAGTDKFDPNEVEINRCHAFIDPICYGRLMEALTFAPPAGKLALPRFHMESERHDDNTHQPARPPGLTEDERQTIQQQLSGQAARRRRSDPQFVSVVVEGAERARMDLGRRNNLTFHIEEGDEMIELRTSADGEELLLAVHPVAYADVTGIAATAATLWRGRAGTLAITITPEAGTAGHPAGARVDLSFQPGLLSYLLPGYSAAHSGPLWPRLALQSLALLALGFVTGRFVNFPNPPHLKTETTILQPPVPQPNPSGKNGDHGSSGTPTTLNLVPDGPAVRSELTVSLPPDDQITRGEGSTDARVTIAPQTSLLNLELPVAADYAHSTFRVSLKHFMKNREILTAHSLAARSSKAGLFVVFPVAARFFAESGEYVLDLQSVGASGKLEEVGTYTFEVVRKSR